MPPVARAPGTVAVGQPAGERAHEKEAAHHGRHVDAGPQRRVREVVAVQRQPDALQPDDEHEHQAALGHGVEKTAQVADRKHADAEQAEVEHGVLDPQFDEDKGDQQEQPRHHAAEHQRIRPAHDRMPVGHDAVGQGDQQDGQAGAESDVAERCRAPVSC